ncbi:MAG TPA: hypothetical protein VF493_11890 [Terriglobales bacterium]
MRYQCVAGLAAILVLYPVTVRAQEAQNREASNKQINVNWLYGSYVPKDVPLRSLNTKERFKLYVRQTYTTPGIYIKTTLFALRDHIHDRNPEWGSGFGGFAKRFADRQGQFIVQNSVSSLGNGVLSWEPRYDRCRCDGFWPRTRHAAVRNFITYDSTEKGLRPQIMPYFGAFVGSALAASWSPEHAVWQVRGYQGVITQVFVGAGINWIGEFAPEIVRTIRRKRQ